VGRRSAWTLLIIAALAAAWWHLGIAVLSVLLAQVCLSGRRTDGQAPPSPAPAP
jgi:hypothetical protein